MMSEACIAPQSGGGFLAGMLNYVDCQAQTIGETGYQALASPTSSVSLALTALLTVFIALYGIRMLMGHVPSLGETMVGILKIGIVMALASSWAAYRIIVYETVLHGPAEIVETIGAPSHLAGAEGGLVARLQWSDDRIVALSALGTGRFDPVPTTKDGIATGAPTSYTPIADDLAFGIARVAYLGSTMGALGIVRLAAGVMLALAPLFAGFLLFDATRSFFIGWARMLVAAALGALAVTVVLGVELGILEPWLANVLALRGAHYATPSAPTELLVMTLAFGLVLFAMVALATRLAFSAQAPLWLRTGATASAAGVGGWGQATASADGLRLDPTQLSRAQGTADAVAALQRRETRETGNSNRRVLALADGPNRASTGPGASSNGFVPLGQSYRRTARRVSAASIKRSRPA
ncbi:MAG: type IV secretion system protein [Sphingomonadales bacterium]|nr:type IV secretion system protein [Sphingomonadales bacterium]